MLHLEFMKFSESDREKARILVVEETEAVFRTLEELLYEHGSQCAFCSDGAEALVEAKAFTPELVLLNPEVPGLDGYQLTEALKASDRTRAIPVVFISSLQSPDARKKAFRSGAADFITKPIEPVELFSRVDRHIRLFRHETAREELNRRLEAAVETRTKDLRSANRRLSEMNQRLAAIDRSKSRFLSSISHELRTPANGFFGAMDLMLMDLGDQVDPELLQMLESSRKRLLSLMDDAFALVSLRTEEDIKPMRLGKLRVLVESSIVSASVRAEIETAFQEEEFKTRISEELFPLAFTKLLIVADGFAVEERIKVKLSSDEGTVLLTVEVPGGRLPEHLKDRFFEDFAVDETDVPRGNVGLGPSVALEASRGMGGDLGVEEREEGLLFKMTLPASTPAGE